MASLKALWPELYTTLQQDIPTTQQLLSLLEREQKALETRNYDAFQALLNEKTPLLQLLEQHAEHRQLLLSRAHLVDEKSALAMADREAPPVARAWRQLAEQWQRCQELNEVNELIAQRTRLVAGQVLDLLRGQTGNNRTYSADGGTSNNTGQRTITSA